MSGKKLKTISFVIAISFIIIAFLIIARIGREFVIPFLSAGLLIVSSIDLYIKRNENSKSILWLKLILIILIIVIAILYNIYVFY